MHIEESGMDVTCARALFRFLLPLRTGSFFAFGARQHHLRARALFRLPGTAATQHSVCARVRVLVRRRGPAPLQILATPGRATDGEQG